MKKRTPLASADRRSGIDMINPRPPSRITDAQRENVAQSLSELRKQWVVIGPHHRCNIRGDKLSREYSRLARAYFNMTGEWPPPIYADL